MRHDRIDRYSAAWLVGTHILLLSAAGLIVPSGFPKPCTTMRTPVIAVVVSLVHYCHLGT